MVKRPSRLIALMTSVILILLLLLPQAIFAAPRSYVALGDSISYGLTDPVTGGYTRMYHTGYLGAAKYSYQNLSYPGFTTSSLLDVISDNSDTIRKGDVFTISIGSNNLLGPAIESIIGLYGLKMSDYSDPDGQDMVRALAKAVKADYDDGDAVTPIVRFSRLMDAKKAPAIELKLKWAAGTALFTLHWPVIMARLRLRAPLAKVYVNNLYNPLTLSVLTDARFQVLHDNLDSFMKQFNDCINRCKGLYAYRVVDVRSPFAKASLYSNPSTAPLTFNIPGALAIAGQPGFNPDNPASFLPFFLCCDPHPTTAGHTLIYKQLVSVS